MRPRWPGPFRLCPDERRRFRDSLCQRARTPNAAETTMLRRQRSARTRTSTRPRSMPPTCSDMASGTAVPGREGSIRTTPRAAFPGGTAFPPAPTRWPEIAAGAVAHPSPLPAISAPRLQQGGGGPRIPHQHVRPVLRDLTPTLGVGAAVVAELRELAPAVDQKTYRGNVRDSWTEKEKPMTGDYDAKELTQRVAELCSAIADSLRHQPRRRSENLVCSRRQPPFLRSACVGRARKTTTAFSGPATTRLRRPTPLRP